MSDPRTPGDAPLEVCLTLPALADHARVARLAMAGMGKSETKVSDLCRELDITRQTLYRHISPQGELRSDGMKLLSRT